MPTDDDDATQPVDAIEEPRTELTPVTQDEIEELRQGYATNRRRSRLGLALGIIALLIVVVATPVAIVLLSQQADIKEQNHLAACRARLEAAHDSAQTEFFTAVISRPYDPARAQLAVDQLNTVRSLRGTLNPCRAARRLPAVLVNPPAVEEPSATTTTTTTTAPPPTAPPGRTSGTSGTPTPTTAPAAPASVGASAAPEQTTPPPDTRPGRRICLPIVGCIGPLTTREQPGGGPEPAKGVPSRRPAQR